MNFQWDKISGLQIHSSDIFNVSLRAVLETIILYDQKELWAYLLPKPYNIAMAAVKNHLNYNTKNQYLHVEHTGISLSPLFVFFPSRYYRHCNAIELGYLCVSRARQTSFYVTDKVTDVNKTNYFLR